MTRKDLARKGQPRSTRFRRGEIEGHVVKQLVALLSDEHRLRHLSGITEGGQLEALFERATLLTQDLQHPRHADQAVRELISLIRVTKTALQIELRQQAFSVAVDGQGIWTHSIPRPTGRPFREAKVKMDARLEDDRYDRDLVALFAEAVEVQRLVLQSPELSLNQLAKREGRCRTHLSRLLRISWLSPRIVEAVAAGTQPKSINRRALLAAEAPLSWEDQERQFWLTA